MKPTDPRYRHLKPQKQPRQASDRTPCLGFRFDGEEEMRMKAERAASARFMRKYGKGRQPFAIDLSHYVPPMRPDNADEYGGV